MNACLARENDILNLIRNTAVMRKNKKSTKANSKFKNIFTWAKSNKKKTAILVVLLVLLLGGGCFAYFQAKDDSDIAPSYSSNNADSAKKVAVLRVESNIVGINMKSAPDCDSAQLKKVTPYECTLQEGHLETVITAPAQTTSNGTVYNFKTWDGCSESNSDKKICRVKLKLDKISSLKATYEKAASGSGATVSTDMHVPGSCRIASKYIIVGPQAFDPAKPAQLILYNRAKSPYQPTFLQIWNNNSCIDVNLGHNIVATDSGYGQNVFAWGLTTSPHPKDVHAYIGVIDNGKTQHPQAIIREDGKVMADEAYLAKKFNAPSVDGWRFEAWMDNKTMLIHAAIEEEQHNNPNYSFFDTNQANWFYYNVETDSYVNKVPPYPYPYIN